MSTPEVGPPKLNDLEKWLKATQGSYGGALNPPAMTFCQCCGSQYLTQDGKIYNSKTSSLHGPTAADAEVFYQNRYGPEWHLRFPGHWPDMLAKATRVNKPGVTIAYMGMKEALDLLYPDPEWRKFGEGYEINDPAFDHPVSVVWVNK